MQGCFEVQRTGQGLTHLDQRRELFDVTCLDRHTPCRMGWQVEDLHTQKQIC